MALVSAGALALTSIGGIYYYWWSGDYAVTVEEIKSKKENGTLPKGNVVDELKKFNINNLKKASDRVLPKPKKPPTTLQDELETFDSTKLKNSKDRMLKKLPDMEPATLKKMKQRRAKTQGRSF